MRFIPLAIALAAGGPALAQPAAPTPSTCTVTIARAPDDVRKVVEGWVRAEPRCNTALEVRIVATEGGYYLLARDEHGRVRERIVPDAQSAGVLIASWVADDSLPAAPPAAPAPPAPASAPPAAAPPAPPAAPPISASVAIPPPPPAMAPPAAPAMAIAPQTPPYAGPSATPPESMAADAFGPGTTPAVGATADAPKRQPRWLTLGAVFAMSDSGGGGLRGEIDLKSWQKWSFGIAAGWQEVILQDVDPYVAPYVTASDYKAIAYLARTSQLGGKWQLRASFGAGLVLTSASAIVSTQYGYETQQADGVSPTAEASVSLSRQLGKNWALTGGPLVSLYAQEYVGSSYDPYSQMQTTIEQRDMDLMMYIGVRHKL